MSETLTDKKELDLSYIDKICEEYKDVQGGTIPLLQKVQDHYGYLSKEMVNKLSENLNKSAHQIYGVISFYAQFYTQPRGKYVIRVCRGTACHVKGSTRISEVVTEEFGIKNGQTSENFLFTLEEVSCIGACGMAPVIMINDRTYGNLTPEKARSIFKDYANKESESAVK
jgi:NADH-quinone oxidoreductase subunit E